MADHEIVTREVDGISVEIDLTYLRSWEGISDAARMGNDKASEVERFVSMGRYYQGACPNVDDVAAQLSEQSDEEVAATDVMYFLARAIKDATPKN